ncbi:phage baseplate assembly protein V [Lichenicola sp.]|uniref:phage baseplate assembly protein V n=1 Tax=Lichenicola sp. TaxID=2804529 RepID=UPI003B00A290
MADWLETIKYHAATQVGAIGQPRHALVTSVDAVAHAVKVSIQPEGIESGWIPDSAIAAGGLCISCPAEIGSQVLVVPVESDAEHPIVIARLFDVTTTPPVSPATGAPVQPGEIGIFLATGTYLHLTSDSIFMRGKVVIDGSLSVNGDAVASSVSLAHHQHAGVQPGQGRSGAPVPTNG